MSGEFDLIDKIRESLGDQPTSLVDLGIGDDCAIIRQPPDQLRWLVTTDMLMQGRHFDLTNDPEQLKSIGQKAIAVNISDIAAMAGTPVAAFVSVALPMESAVNSARFLTEGMRLESEKFQISLAGGDTNFWSGPLVINVTLTGYEPEGGAVLRSGAKVGDLICVSGPLGGSLPSGRHLRPEPRIRFAQELKRRLGPCLHAMIDISDGLAGDLRHILAESGGLGAQLVASQIPVHQDVLLCHPETADNLEQQLGHAMGDGEDFELCFCIDPDSSENDLPEGSRIIGNIIENKSLQMIWPDGKVKPWTGSGFDHGRSPLHKIPSSGSGWKCN
ncbi:MAG: Thiamine-monophosphate kinase [Planctomycetota bacterium]